MISPWFIATSSCGLFPPSIDIGYVHTPVAVDVARADTMGRAVALLGNVMDNPSSCGIRWIGLGISNSSFCDVNQFWLSVTVNVPDHADLTLIRRDHFELVPAAVLALRIDIE